jgi:hypothetical protein
MTGCGDCTLSSPCGGSGALRSLDLTTFDSVPPFNDLRFEDIRPFRSFDHWRLRWVPPTNWPDSVATLFAGGDLPWNDLPASVRETIDTLRVWGGFTFDCAPASCGRHFVSVAGTSVQVWADRASARAFLGRIESSTEAVILAMVEGYSFSSVDRRLGGVRGDGDGFQLVASRVVTSCDPFETKRYLLRVGPDGDVGIQDSQTIELRKDCIVV